MKIPDGARQAGSAFLPGAIRERRNQAGHEGGRMSRAPPFVSVGFGFLLPQAEGSVAQAEAGGGGGMAAAAPVHPQRRDQKPSLAPDLSLLYKSRLIRAPSRKLPLLYSSSALPPPCITPSSARHDHDAPLKKCLPGCQRAARTMLLERKQVQRVPTSTPREREP